LCPFHPLSFPALRRGGPWRSELPGGQRTFFRLPFRGSLKRSRKRTGRLENKEKSRLRGPCLSRSYQKGESRSRCPRRAPPPPLAPPSQGGGKGRDGRPLVLSHATKTRISKPPFSPPLNHYSSSRQATGLVPARPITGCSTRVVPFPPLRSGPHVWRDKRSPLPECCIPPVFVAQPRRAPRFLSPPCEGGARGGGPGATNCRVFGAHGIGVARALPIKRPPARRGGDPKALESKAMNEFFNRKFLFGRGQAGPRAGWGQPFSTRRARIRPGSPATHRVFRNPDFADLEYRDI